MHFLFSLSTTTKYYTVYYLHQGTSTHYKNKQTQALKDLDFWMVHLYVKVTSSLILIQ
jgi:uncharacterized protein (DUF927 family)